MEAINELSFRRIQLVGEYVSLNKQLADLLDNVRFGVSKARTLNGVTLTSMIQLDTLELEPTARFDVKKGVYSIIEEETGKDETVRQRSKKEKLDEKAETKDKETTDESAEGTKTNVKVPAFRPFGVLEPMSAKDARRSMAAALKIVCELSTLQSEIRSIDSQLESSKESLASTEIDDVTLLTSLLKV